MSTFPFYIILATICTTLLTLYFFWRASQHSKMVLTVSFVWLGIQTAIGLSGFYTVTDTLPPRFALALMPPLLFTIALFVTKQGRIFLDGVNPKWLTLLHVVRVPVEVLLLWLALHKYVPRLMTFEGRNFDVLSGLTAPLVFYLGYVKRRLGRTVLLCWNFICVALLLNIVANAILSAPFPFQRFGFEQPNVAVLYFPFVWLPAFIVPVVLFSHLASIRQLFRQGQADSSPSVSAPDPFKNTSWQ